MKNFLRLGFNILMIAVVIACQSAGQSTDNSMLKPGDSINGMILTQGTADAVPLWAFCSSTQENKHTITANCRVPLLSRLAIGYIFLSNTGASTRLDWSEFMWELSVDDRSLDLDAFGTYDYVMPTLSAPPCPVREVFVKLTAWDVVLTDLKLGTYTLRGRAQGDTDIYTWIINLMIEPPEKL